eukprot:SAG22_NODE_10_length_35702_cov_72.266992_19_plen_79_part_00
MRKRLILKKSIKSKVFKSKVFEHHKSEIELLFIKFFYILFKMFGYSLIASGKIRDSRPLKKKGWKKRIKKIVVVWLVE